MAMLEVQMSLGEKNYRQPPSGCAQRPSDLARSKVGGMKTTILQGQSLATGSGPTSVYFQTKNVHDLVDMLGINQRAETISGSGMSVGRFCIG
jgi:hypothetical protein